MKFPRVRLNVSQQNGQLTGEFVILALSVIIVQQQYVLAQRRRRRWRDIFRSRVWRAIQHIPVMLARVGDVIALC